MILLTYMRMSKQADAFHPSVRATQEEKSMAETKRGRYWHYEFMIDGQKYRGTTKETAKSRANTFESLLIAEIRANRQQRELAAGTCVAGLRDALPSVRGCASSLGTAGP
jgi:hypothetical protein